MDSSNTPSDSVSSLEPPAQDDTTPTTATVQAFPTPRPSSTMSTTSSAASSLRERRVVSHLHVNVPSSPAPYLASSSSLHSQPSPPAIACTADMEAPHAVGSTPRLTTSTLDLGRASGPVMGLGLGLALGGSHVHSADLNASYPDSDEDEVPSDQSILGSSSRRRDREHDDDRVSGDNDQVLLTARQRPSRRDWGDEDIDDANAPESFASPPLSPLSSRTGLSESTIVAARKPSLAGSAITSLGMTEEWRAKILDGVRRGEERVAAQKRKESYASMNTLHGPLSSPSLQHSSPPSIPQDTPPVPEENALVPDNSISTTETTQVTDPFPSASISMSHTNSSSSTDDTSAAYADARESTSLPTLNGGVTRPESPAPSFRSVEEDPVSGRDRQHETSETSEDGSMSSINATQSLSHDTHPDGFMQHAAGEMSNESSQEDSGTYVSVADPSHLTMLGGTQREVPNPAITTPVRAKSMRKNFFTTLLYRAQNPSLSSHGPSHARSSSSPALGADPLFPGRTARSQPGTPATQHRHRMAGGMIGSVSGGAISALTSTRQPTGLGINQPSLSSSQTDVTTSNGHSNMARSASTGGLLSRQSTIGSSGTTASASATPQSTPRLPYHGTSGSPSLAHSSVPFFRSPTSLSKARVGTSPASSSRPTLDTLGLKVVSLTPTLSVSKYAQPLCGAVLDEKYLLIGTTAGLDFLPLQHVVADKTGGIGSLGSSLKPISLIKKTKFKSLEVLEIRSNILLAIAGRNNHLRVYALDGIRAIINKRMAEMTTKDEFIFLPSSLSRSLHSSSDPKGKSKAAGLSRSAAATPKITNPLSRAPTASSSASPVVGPHSPPPPYAQPLPVDHEANPSHDISSPPLSTTLKRSRSLAQPKTNGAMANVGIHQSKSSASVATPHSVTTSTANMQQSEPSNNIDTDPSRPANPGSMIAGPSVESRSVGMAGSLSLPHLSAPNPSDDQLEPSGSHDNIPGSQSLKSVSMSKSASASSIKTPGSATRRRFIPRSPRVQQELTDEDDGAAQGPHGEANRGSKEIRRTGRGLTLADVLAEGPSEKPVHDSSTMMSRHPSIPPASGSPKIWKPEPRSPIVATSPKEVIEEDDDRTTTLNPHRRASLAQILAEGPPPGMNEGAQTSTTSPIASSLPAEGSRRSIYATDSDGSPDIGRRGKRWSLIDSMFKAGGNNVSDSGGASLSVSPVVNASSSHMPRVSVEGVATPGASPQANSMVSPDQRRHSSDVVVERDDQGMAPIEGTSGNLSSISSAGLRSRSSINKLRPVVTGDRDEPNDVHLHAQVTSDRSKTAPHPATLGTPLEYVKLARTKGARLLKAVETRKRTYLAVLCGENGERVELFTGSKNISLSLNRTFILPETPRTIEFQIQGDDLVDIYLVYDESIFALEPATVRVREVGIGRNERRAARRERERSVRDIVSQERSGSPANLASTGSSSQGSASRSPHQTSRNDQGTTQNDQSPAEQDDGLSLAPPVNSISRSNNMAATSSGGPTESSSSATTPDNPPTTDGSATAWPYTTFQQLAFIPPLPPSVLGSSFVIPPTYDTVVSAQNTPALPQVAQMGAIVEGSDPPFNVHLPPNGYTSQGEDAVPPAPWQSPNPNVPLLSPISLLAHPATRNIGPPGLFFVSRGKKITAIVDCDGRSVLKRPFLWQAKNSQPENAILGLKRIDAIVVDQKRTILIGIHAAGLSASEICARVSATAPHDEWSNGSPVNVTPGTMKISQGSNREVTWLGSSKRQNEVIWADRIGNSFGVFALTPIV